MKKRDKKRAESSKMDELHERKPLPVARAKALGRLGRKKGLLDGAISSPLLQWIGERLSLDGRLAAAFAALFAEAIDDAGHVDLNAVAKKHGLEGEKRLEFTAAVEKLRRSGLVMDRNPDRKKPSILLDSTVTIDAVVFTEVLHGEDSDAGVDFGDALAVVNEADDLIKLCLCRDMSRQVFLSRLGRLAAKSRGRNPLGEWLKGMPAVEMALFFMAAAYAACSQGTFDVDDFLGNCQLPMGEKGRFLRLVRDGRSLAVKRGLVEFKKNERSGTLAFRLASGPLNKLYPRLRGSGPGEEKESGRAAGLMPCPGKRARLFLPPALEQELATLGRACAPAGFRLFQEGLKKAGLPPGLTILLHGVPGTGKTVAAFNLARAGKLPVMQVDMSQLRDKYVGESEKNMAAVFARWRERRDGGKGPAPLLLLNEADAMVCRRVDVGHSVDQMNNIMQNVLLEELERFDGILVATTNLVANIDGAFDRRFLYKLRFDPPGEEERRRIWLSRMPELPKRWAARLASYPLSGAQIENVARRALLDWLMKKRVTLAGLESMVTAEGAFREAKKRVKVTGFSPAPRNAERKEAS